MGAQIIAIVLGIILIIFGSNEQKKRKGKLNSGKYKEIIATVTSYIEKKSMDTDSDGFSYETTIYYPIYEYSVDGKTYNYEGRTGSSHREKLGKTMILLYNTENPSDCFSPKDKFGIFVLLLGIFLLGLGVVSMFLK